MPKDWQVERPHEVAEAPHFRVIRAHYRRSDGFARDMFTLAMPDWTNIVAVTPERRVVLIRQYRPGPRQFTVELPGGRLEPGEPPADAARRELLEESGYTVDEIRPLGSPFPNPALQDNRIHYFLGLGARRSAPPTFDGEGEECDPFEASLDEIDAMTDEGVFSHALCWAALARARPWLTSR